MTPPAALGLQLGLNYYRIEYSDKIEDPPFNVLANPSAYGELIIRDPSIAQVDAAIAAANLGDDLQVFDYPNYNPVPVSSFDPSAIEVVVDLRRRNLAVLNTSGLDVSAQYGFDAGGGNIRLGLTGTYIFEREKQLTVASAAVETIDTFYNPPNWRARASLGWERQAWAANLFVNHKDSYTDSRRPAPVPVSSYTTADLQLAYDFKNRFSSGFLAGLTVSTSVQNLFDRNPPRTAIAESFRDLGFDPTNADPMGRLLAIEVVKTW